MCEPVHVCVVNAVPPEYGIGILVTSECVI